MLTRTGHRRVRSHRGFTLIELLVVVAIIALLISILLPSLKRARDQAKTTVCLSNLHQLGLVTTNYVQDFKGSLPFFKGLTPPNNAPYLQYHQIFNFINYLKDLKIYRCPSATDEVSVKNLADTNPNPRFVPRYIVDRSDQRYRQHRTEFPDIDPANYPTGLIDPLYTEYWSNDWSSGATDPLGMPIPAVNGGNIDKIPNVNYAVIMSDACWWWWELGGATRHNEANNLLYLDAHAARVAKQKYHDRGYVAENRQPMDSDAWNCRPFYAWGLTRNGVNGASEN